MTIEVQAILFDLDGTLVDSTAVVERLWREWAAHNGVDAERLLAVSHGRPAHQTISMFAPHLDAHAEAAAHVAAEEVDTNGVVALPGAKDLLNNVPSDRWAIVTSCPRRLGVIRLGAADLPVPPVMITADAVRLGKPDPEPYLLAAAALGRAPAECLVVEDAPAGIESGLSAGMRVLAIQTTHAAHELRATWIIPDLTYLTVETRADAIRVCTSETARSPAAE